MLAPRLARGLAADAFPASHATDKRSPLSLLLRLGTAPRGDPDTVLPRRRQPFHFISIS